MKDGTAESAAKAFEHCWLARYPWPDSCVHDKGGEFTGDKFQQLLISSNIRADPITTKNPQGQGAVERMHETIGNIIRTLEHAHPPTDIMQAEEIVDDALATAMHAMRVTYSRVLKSSPGALIYDRDMFLDLPVVADWVTIQNHRQRAIEANLRYQNQRRRRYDYQPNDYILIKVYEPDKLQERAIGPFRIHQVHTNGTVTIVRHPHIYILERINIRRIRPYRN